MDVPLHCAEYISHELHLYMNAGSIKIKLYITLNIIHDKSVYPCSFQNHFNEGIYQDYK